MAPIEYIIRRAAQLGLIVFIAVTINFLIPRAIPGDPIEAALQNRLVMSGNMDVNVQEVAAIYRAKFGLDKPLWHQYLAYLTDLSRLEFGVSLIDFPQPVIGKILNALPRTIGLLSVSTAIAFTLGTLFGALLAWPRVGRLVQALVPPIILLSAVPAFLLAIILLWLFAVEWQLFPPGGGFDTTTVVRWDLPSAIDIAQHAVLPALALVLAGMGSWALAMRGMMVSVLGEDYITFADAKGLSTRRIFAWYGVRNALLPQVTQLAVALGSIMSGAVLVEAMFNYPGLGGILFLAIAGKDYFVIQGIVLMLILALALALFAVDLIYPIIDPRIRYQR